MMRAVVVLIVLALLSPAVMAQPGSGAAVGQRRERIKKRVLALRASTLIDELSLDEQAAAKLFPVLSKYDAEFEKLLIARADLTRRLQAAADLPDPRAIDKLIDDSVANQRGFWDFEEKRLVELRKILTPAQMARLLIVLPALERRIQNQLRKVVRADAARLGGNADGDDEDVVPAAQPPGATKPTAPAPSDGHCDPFTSPSQCSRPRGGDSQKPTPTRPVPTKKAPKPCDPFTALHGCG
jgi:Spy/CpxP family protein refolding chaperone